MEALAMDNHVGDRYGDRPDDALELHCLRL